MASADQDKTEEPTSYRLEEARKRGEVAKSIDMAGTVVLITFAVTMVLTARGIFAAVARATEATLLAAGAGPVIGAGWARYVNHVWTPVWHSMLPLVLALLVAAVLGNVLQTGPVLSAHPITPDFKRLNPAQGLKRILSFRTVWELGKLLLKLVLLGALAWMVARGAHGLIESLATMPVRKMPAVALTAFGRASLYVLGVLALVAVLDVLMSRREFLRKMRTSRRELRDEIKRRDGDPEVKSRQKQLIRDLLRKARSLHKTAGADVVLTNPTHVAVALRYRPAQSRAPVVVAKGAGPLATRMRVLARRHGIPQVRSPALARALYKDVELDRPVSESHYSQLAPLYRWLLSGRVGTVEFSQ